jgi:hypothetical protein
LPTDERQKECGDGVICAARSRITGEKEINPPFKQELFAETAQHPLFEGRVGAFFRERISSSWFIFSPLLASGRQRSRPDVIGTRAFVA